MGLAGLGRRPETTRGRAQKCQTRLPLISPQLGPVYQALFPWAEALLRAVVGLSLVPHALRSTFGMFPSTGAQSHNLTEFANELDSGGYHPGRFWAYAIVLTRSLWPVRCSRWDYSPASPPARSSFFSW